MDLGLLPATIREIPDSWWDLIMDTGQWYVCSDDFGIANVDLQEFRNYFYRRAQTRQLAVATTIDRRRRRLYLQARLEHFYINKPVWDNVRPVPPLPRTLASPDLTNRYAEIGRRIVTLLRSVGYQVIEPDLGPPPQLPPGEPKPFDAPDLAARYEAPPGWNWSVFQPGQLLPPGVPDIKGAVYPDDADRFEMAALAVEFQEMSKRCDCGTDDLRYHPPTCAVAG